MRDVALIGFAVFIGAAGFAISVLLPLIAWYRRRKAALALLPEFLAAIPEIIGFRYRRTKMLFGDGFLDDYSGEIGNLAFGLSVEIVPFRKEHTYRLRLERCVAGHDPLVRETSSSADPAGPDPLARAAAGLRRVRERREGYVLFEAS